MRSAAALLFVALACHAPIPSLPPDDAATFEPPAGGEDEIVVCGRRYPIGTPVVLWTDPGGYDAYATDFRFGTPKNAKDAPERGELRYDPGRKERGDAGRVLVPAEGAQLADLGRVVDLFVLHYDVCGLSRTCFKVLHDLRGLSVHFLLDIDGTIYQTMDLRDQAWHAAQANPRSIGIEIANMGARSPGDYGDLREWYPRDAQGTRIRVPVGIESGVRTRDFVGRPARDRPVSGTIHGEALEMYDFTPQQYDALVKLTAELCRLFPGIEADAPRDGAGRVRTDALSDAELASFGGVLGHYHVTERKRDPGPAFDWPYFLARVRAWTQVQP